MNSPAVPGPAGPPGGSLRASDADRERVAEILREAAGDGRLTLDELDERLDAVYQAKTYAELEPVTRDLPHSGAGHLPVPAPATAANPDRFGGQPGMPVGIALMSGFTRKGDWVVPRELSLIAIMGGCEIDMREARFEEPTVKINIVAIMGGAEITVPEDATVRVNGIGIMADGAFRARMAMVFGTALGPDSATCSMVRPALMNALSTSASVCCARRTAPHPHSDVNPDGLPLPEAGDRGGGGVADDHVDG
jgi:hypothetical protein